MAAKDDVFLKKLLATFRVEADEHLRAISSGLVELEKVPTASRRKEIIEAVFREAHSLKGAARAVNYLDVEAVCRPMENLLDILKQDGIPFSRELFDLLHDAVQELKTLLERGAKTRGAADQPVLDSLIRRIDAAAKGGLFTAGPAAAAGGKVAARGRRPRGGAAPERKSPKTAVEPAVTPSTAAAETIRVSTSKLASLFRQAEEMISAKLVGEQMVRDLRHVGANLDARAKSWANLSASLGKIQSMAGSAAPEVMKLSEALQAELHSVRLLAGELRVATNAAESDQRALRKIVDSLLEDAKKLLMLPLSSLFEVLPGLVRNLARDQGKEVDLIVHGAEIEIDRRIQEEIKDPLIHIVRNCVDHGIEAPRDRAMKMKSPRGTIRIDVSQKDVGKAEIVVSDDGAGIKHAEVLSTAQKLGLITEDESARLNEQDAASLVFQSGISTSKVVTDISGRGLGLAIVMEKVEKLGGSVSLESHRDAGTTIRMVLPLTLAALSGVVVRAGGQLFAIPTAGIERVMRVERGDIRTVENRETVRMNGRVLSLVRLSDVFGLQRGRAPEDSDAFERIVVLASKGERIAFAVDEILNEQEVLLKGLGSQLSRVRNISGATTLGTGALVPVLNVPDLMRSGIEAETHTPSGIEAEAAVAEQTSILVVEDSITARSLLKNILEAAGYAVKTAVDGVDALTALKAGQFDLVVSDVEMPRMDGFDLTAKIRADKKLAELPVVLVTALESREHRERGIDAGANAYIVKSGFDQTNLLEVIRRLV